ncbi:MAG: hypothetical protein J5819_00605 [Eubacterium sp.]|nr:hypothetical protein [Eubacterium sp.]
MKIMRNIVLVVLMLCFLSSCSSINEQNRQENVDLSYSIANCTESAILPTESPIENNSTPMPDDNNPADTEVFRFSSYDEMFTTLFKQNSSEHRSFLEKLDKNNYSSVFYSFIENLESNKKSIPLPYLSGEAMEVSSSVEWQRISLFTEELFGLPWIWFYCSYKEQTVVVSLGSFKEMNIADGNYSYIELIDLISPGFPQPNNKESFDSTYNDIEFQTLSLSGNLNVDATVYYFKNGRVHYRFLIGDYIVSVWRYDGGTISDDYWNSFSLKISDDEYNHGYDETQVSEINDPDESIIPESPIIIATPSVEPVVTPAPTATDVPQDTPVSTTDSRPTLKPTEEPETTADLPDDDPTETVFRFTSYESLITTLCEKNSEEHILFREGINGKNYSGLFIELIDKLESENESLLLPYFDGELALIDSAREWQKITLFSEDLFGIPWLWFYCSIGGESYVICLSPLDVGLEIGDYNDFISVFYGDDFTYPMPSNKTEFSDIYSDIYSEELIFHDGTSCSSTVYELRTGRIQYRFILGNCIFSIWKYNGGSIPNQTWQKLSFDYYSE